MVDPVGGAHTLDGNHELRIQKPQAKCLADYQDGEAEDGIDEKIGLENLVKQGLVLLSEGHRVVAVTGGVHGTAHKRERDHYAAYDVI